MAQPVPAINSFLLVFHLLVLAVAKAVKMFRKFSGILTK